MDEKTTKSGGLLRRFRRAHVGRSVLRSRRGMSLVEVMVVIAIILTLMGVLAFGVFSVFGEAQVDATRLTMNRINQRLEIYHLRKKKVPSGLEEVFADDRDGVPTDAWGNEFRLVTPGPGNDKWDLISMGADGSEGGTGQNADLKSSEP
jgi:general secretion pathway protein G